MAGKPSRLKIDWFSTIAEAEQLARNKAADLSVRCTVTSNATARRMMQILAAAEREKLEIILPVFQRDLGSVVRKAAVRRLALVDRTQVLKTIYLFERDDEGALSRLAVTVAVPTAKTKVLGCSVSKDFINGIFEGLEKCLASLPARAITTLSIRTKPALSKREHKQRLAAIAKRFKATVA